MTFFVGIATAYAWSVLILTGSPWALPSVMGLSGWFLHILIEQYIKAPQ